MVCISSTFSTSSPSPVPSEAEEEKSEEVVNANLFALEKRRYGELQECHSAEKEEACQKLNKLYGIIRVKFQRTATKMAEMKIEVLCATPPPPFSPRKSRKK